MEKNASSTKIKYKREYPPKKFLNEEENSKDIIYSIEVLTNLTRLQLNEKAIQGVYLYGCDIEEEEKNEMVTDFNPVNVMRKARKLQCFQDKIKQFVSQYYISGLVLMGKPIDENEDLVFKFYLKMKEVDSVVIKSEISNKLSALKNNLDKDENIYKFKFKRKKGDLLKLKEDENSGDALCVANYLNICLGKLLKKSGYTKDRSSRKILYYNKNQASHAQNLKNSDFLFFPALKAVCESYEGGIFMKLLPKKLLKDRYTYDEYFYSLKSPNNDIEEILDKKKKKVVKRRALKIYNQAFIKIDDVIYDNPFKITFKDKHQKEWTVGDYYREYWKINVPNEKIPLVVRYIDKGGKLKGEDILKIHIPCYLLEIIGNVFNKKIKIKDIVQPPHEKLYEITEIRKLIEESTTQSNDNYIGKVLEPIALNGQIINPPLIIFDENIKHETKNGNFDLLNSSPYSKIKELKKIDIYLLDLDQNRGNFIWDRLKEASEELGIKFKENPTFYQINNYQNQEDFEKYISDYFKKCDEHYINNETDFIFMFMDSTKKSSFQYRIFKSIINKFNWSIPTQVILFDENKFSKKTNLSQFTNILCQMWAKKGNELYICDFSFVPKTMVIAYSSMGILGNKVLTSISISLGTKLYEYMFYSEIGENENTSSVSPSIKSLLIKSLKAVGKHLKKGIENIVIYRDAVNERQQNLIYESEIDFIKKAIEKANEELEKKIYSNTKWSLILVSKINEIKMFINNEQGGGNNFKYIENIPVGTIIDKEITHKDKYDFFLNSTESRQGTCSSTHYTVLYDDTNLSAIQIYKLTYYLTYLSYNTTKSIRVPAPLYFVTRRNKFTSENLRGEIINPKFRTLNISL